MRAYLGELTPMLPHIRRIPCYLQIVLPEISCAKNVASGKPFNSRALAEAKAAGAILSVPGNTGSDVSLPACPRDENGRSTPAPNRTFEQDAAGCPARQSHWIPQRPDWVEAAPKN